MVAVGLGRSKCLRSTENANDHKTRTAGCFQIPVSSRLQNRARRFVRVRVCRVFSVNRVFEPHGCLAAGRFFLSPAGRDSRESERPFAPALPRVSPPMGSGQSSAIAIDRPEGWHSPANFELENESNQIHNPLPGETGMATVESQEWFLPRHKAVRRTFDHRDSRKLPDPGYMGCAVKAKACVRKLFRLNSDTAQNRWVLPGLTKARDAMTPALSSRFGIRHCGKPIAFRSGRVLSAQSRVVPNRKLTR